MAEQPGSTGGTEGRVPPPARPAGDTAHPRLSLLDVEMLRSMAQGMPLDEISQQVGVSRLSLVRRVERLMALLGVRDRAELVAKAERENLIQGSAASATDDGIRGS